MKPISWLLPALGWLVLTGCGSTPHGPVAPAQQAACDRIENLGGTVETNPAGAIVGVRFVHTHVADAELACLDGLTELRALDLCRARVTDAGLPHLRGLRQLRGLDLQHTKVTDAGLRCLTGLSQLQELDLVDTAITDAGLEHLKGLTQLRWLYLRGSQATVPGVAKLQQALPDCVITTGDSGDRDAHDHAGEHNADSPNDNPRADRPQRIGR
jgi:hypothetical protein